MRSVQARAFVSSDGVWPMTQQPEHQSTKDHLEQLIEELRCFAYKGTHVKIGTNPVEEHSSFICRILQDLLSGLKDTRAFSHSTAQQIHTFMISHLHQGPTLKDLSLFLGYSEKYCSQLFHTVIGESFRFYLKTLRIERAKFLLQEGQINLMEIATALGFSDQFAFSHFFKNAVGCSPSCFRTLFEDISEVQPAQNANERKQS